ncbi:hypothetical protein ACLI1A_10875 [Flavobacterium sp. RHBU_3]|uniref:hypothetical protein n=1 Tax=Flavobacterium sp. RHBU_3 TaxID=3391184 RepID=UPI00398471DA
MKTQSTSAGTEHKVLNVLKWIFAIFFLFGGLGMLTKGLYITGLLLILLGLLLLPVVSNKINLQIWKNRAFRYISYSVIFILAALMNPNGKKERNEIDFEDKEDIVVAYIKKDTLDKSIQTLKHLGEIGELFKNGNYSTKYPHDGYISEQIDSLSKKKILVFNPRYDFENAKTYLKEDLKNGLIRNYVINFEVDDNGKLISKKTIITYSKIGQVEYQNNNVPEYTTFIDGKIVENQKLNVEAEKLIAKQKEEYEKNRADFEESCLSSWDGSNRELVKIVKKNMNDPDSFEHVETSYKLYNDYAVVIMQFRGKNAFNGTVLNSVTAKVSLEDCSVISVE